MASAPGSRLLQPAGGRPGETPGQSMVYAAGPPPPTPALPTGNHARYTVSGASVAPAIRVLSKANDTTADAASWSSSPAGGQVDELVAASLRALEARVQQLEGNVLNLLNGKLPATAAGDGAVDDGAPSSLAGASPADISPELQQLAEVISTGLRRLECRFEPLEAAALAERAAREDLQDRIDECLRELDTRVEDARRETDCVLQHCDLIVAEQAKMRNNAPTGVVTPSDINTLASTTADSSAANACMELGNALQALHGDLDVTNALDGLDDETVDHPRLSSLLSKRTDTLLSEVSQTLKLESGSPLFRGLRAWLQCLGLALSNLGQDVAELSHCKSLASESAYWRMHGSPSLLKITPQASRWTETEKPSSQKATDDVAAAPTPASSTAPGRSPLQVADATVSGEYGGSFEPKQEQAAGFFGFW
eukprot:TRINITY_DN21122_c0_g1_i7.p1 TRINITY_DN21122_c0_g1~~TRINITY_DN21122_c0_g1_i7.p1  ORF type:complete len:424 (+),score=87.68 TRINITY_DN21122_c0_g1_i7:48-1319(+)